MSAMHTVKIPNGEDRPREATSYLGDAPKDLQRILRTRGGSEREAPGLGELLLDSRTLRILSLYFVSRFLGLFAMVLAAAFLVLATIELVLNLDDVANFSGADAAGGVVDTLRYLGLRLTSYYLADILPIASFLAVFVAFAIAGRTMEILALEAGGVRPIRIVLPVLAAALILSLATAVLHETVILRAEQIWSGEDPAKETEIDFGREAFWIHKGLAITRVGRSDPESHSLFDVEIFERASGGAVTRVIYADRIQVAEDGVWRTESARIWRFDPSDPESDPEISFGEPFELNFAALDADVLRGADPKMLPIKDLRRYLDGQPTETPTELRQIRARYHERLASPWLVLVFAWLAVPLSLRVDQRGRIAGPAVAGVVTLALYFVCQSAGQTLAQQELIPVGIAPWAVMAAFSAAGLFFFRRS